VASFFINWQEFSLILSTYKNIDPNQSKIDLSGQPSASILAPDTSNLTPDERGTMRPPIKIIPIVLSLLVVFALGQQIPSQSSARHKRIVIAARAVLDGKGHVLRNTRMVIEGETIVALDPKAGPVDYDLQGLTAMPELASTCSHRS
jgi:hypothetical protein